ncbi:MAG TPA: dTDP-4-dehydrorhamnose 3,5-epimerase family protein [Actinomycetota bacterium]|nr:dTDP-4-dehydrorhamnose 3,5-epimerase family protein [Actinomycetota bacterium]
MRIVPLTLHADGRGSLTEIFRRSWVPGAREVVQVNLSISDSGVLRGLHFHRRQADYWCVLSGRALVGLFDLREGSPTRMHKAEVPLDAELERVGLYLPPGIAHGFYAQTELVLAYLVDGYFTGEDELGLAWDDPEVAIAWPTDAPILSERDRSNPSLAQALAHAPTFVG